MELIGTGTSRKAFQDGKLVIKQHTHILGYQQSLNELTIYNNLPELFKPYFNPILKVTKDYQLCEYVEPYTTEDESPYDLSVIDDPKFIDFKTYTSKDGYWQFTPDDKQLFKLLEQYDLALGELYGTNNFGVKDNHVVFLDYGMTNSLMKEFEKELASGNLPAFIEDYCTVCHTDRRFCEIHHCQPYCMVCGTLLI